MTGFTTSDFAVRVLTPSNTAGAEAGLCSCVAKAFVVTPLVLSGLLAGPATFVAKPAMLSGWLAGLGKPIAGACTLEIANVGTPPAAICGAKTLVTTLVRRGFWAKADDDSDVQTNASAIRLAVSFFIAASIGALKAGAKGLLARRLTGNHPGALGRNVPDLGEMLPLSG